MNDLINQLFDIATNDEFSPGQRKELMAIAIKDANEPKTASVADIMIDHALGQHLTKQALPHGGIRFGFDAGIPTD